MSELKPGQKAPDFAVATDAGKKVKLSDFKGKKIVLYFYPKDDTSGCTKEACAFRDGIDAIRNLGAVVLGVSPDSVESHVEFRDYRRTAGGGVSTGEDKRRRNPRFQFRRVRGRFGARTLEEVSPLPRVDRD